MHITEVQRNYKIQPTKFQLGFAATKNGNHFPYGLSPKHWEKK